MPGNDQREQVLAAFDGLRVADVRDGMDTMGFHRVGSMSPEIRPLWRTRAFGVARTARYTQYDGPMPTKTGDDYAEWVSWYYREVCPYPWMAYIEPGDFIVIDQSGIDAGLMGSNNTLDGVRRGAKGYVSNGGVRDTDEVILQKVPFWSAFVSQSMVQGRLRFDAKDVPVSVGGVTVHPGDVVVADGDGVIVVPRAAALDVAKYAGAILKSDKAGRRKHYEALGMELDETVREE
ncbi:MAG: dimethylmenaquinone methyltransferase [Planctomycetes bacterium DG_58]|nr:MAG: dimethylmenaquinone methyltransferase [Planctomycetes bacterium DG_58]